MYSSDHGEETDFVYTMWIKICLFVCVGAVVSYGMDFLSYMRVDFFLLVEAEVVLYGKIRDAKASWRKGQMIQESKTLLVYLKQQNIFLN